MLPNGLEVLTEDHAKKLNGGTRVAPRPPVVLAMEIPSKKQKNPG